MDRVLLLWFLKQNATFFVSFTFENASFHPLLVQRHFSAQQFPRSISRWFTTNFLIPVCVYVCVSVCMMNVRCYARSAHLLLVCILVDADLSVNQSISNGPLFGSQWFSSLLNFYFFWLICFSFRFVSFLWMCEMKALHPYNLFNHMLPIFAAVRH